METAEKKVEDGKLVKVDLEADEVIEELKIYGDFFVEPPEALRDIREKMVGLRPEKEQLIDNIESVDAELIGFSSEDLAETIMEAYEK